MLLHCIYRLGDSVWIGNIERRNEPSNQPALALQHRALLPGHAT